MGGLGRVEDDFGVFWFGDGPIASSFTKTEGKEETQTPREGKINNSKGHMIHQLQGHCSPSLGMEISATVPGSGTLSHAWT